MRAAEARIDALLARARAAGVDRLDAQLLAAHGLGRPREWVLAHGDEALDAAQVAAITGLFERRARGEPLAYLVGTREFHGLELQVTPDVLVPRPDTETLVDWALGCLAGPLAACATPVVADLGTGSGAIALAVASHCRRAQVHASDASAAALAVARCNAERLGLVVHWHTGAWWRAFTPGWRADLVLSNPPYVGRDDPHLAALGFEPRAALVPQGDRGDGLADLERLIAGAPTRLNAGGWLLLEHGAGQADAVAQRLREAGFVDVSTRCDLAGRPRASGGRVGSAAGR